MSSQMGIPVLWSRPISSRISNSTLTMTLITNDTIHPSTITSFVNALSGNCGSHWEKDTRRKQILQIKATLERKRSTPIFTQKSGFRGKIPLKYQKPDGIRFVHEVYRH